MLKRMSSRTPAGGVVAYSALQEWWRVEKGKGEQRGLGIQGRALPDPKEASPSKHVLEIAWGGGGK